ncbi:MAG TPA: D-aminoacylase [Acidobacteriota bacterium]|nr:D-aminoacylase [Acidobacteriota bacterium]
MKKRWISAIVALLVAGIWISCTQPTEYDLVIRNGMIYDGLGGEPYQGDVAVNGDTIAAVGDIGAAVGTVEIDAQGQAVAPGFINMLSWATESLIADGRAMSDVLQGVTLEVMGEGWSMGPLSEAMKEEASQRQGDLKYPIEWTTLGQYLEYLEAKGVSVNVASYLGATTLRIHEVGYEDRPPNEEELERMRQLVRQGMQEGALGIGSSLIYAPAFYASTEELIELCKVASEYGGSYISHMRSEGNQLLEAVDELLRIAQEADIPAEIYHLKAAGNNNWLKMDQTIAKIDEARAQGIEVRADMYTYTAGATGLDASMPPWVQEGGLQEWIERLKDPEVRRRLSEEMTTHTDEWENLFHAAGSAENLLLVEFRNDELKELTGKTLAEVAEMRGTSPAETAMDLVIEDNSRVGTVYFLMDEENIKKKIAQPWMTFGSDAGAPATEGVFLRSNPHPRAYGNFARLLGKYVREEQVISLQEAVRRLTSLPADNLKISQRGRLAEGYFADVVIFDPEAVIDKATFEQPHQYAEGVLHVFVNGEQVVQDGQHTGAFPGRVVRGPGYAAAGGTDGE